MNFSPLLRPAAPSPLRSPAARVLLAVLLSASAAGACGRTELDAPAIGGGTGAAPGSGTGGRSGGSGGRGVDGGADVRSDGGPVLPPPSPGITPCGPTFCVSEVMTCCLDAVSGGLNASCIPAGSACPGEASLACDEPADCRSGGVCCATVNLGAGASAPISTRCAQRSACAGLTSFVICRQNTDCAGATPVCCSDLGIPICQARCSR